MAFMVPVVKNNYNLYPGLRSGSGTPQSSRGSSLSGSPTGASSFMSSPRSSQSPAFGTTPKSVSQNSLNKFHNKVLDKLRKTFRSKDCDSHSSSSNAAVL